MVLNRSRYNASSILIFNTMTLTRVRVINTRQTTYSSTHLRVLSITIFGVLNYFATSGRITHSSKSHISSNLHRMVRPLVRTLTVVPFTLLGRTRRTKGTFMVLKRNLQQTMNIRTATLTTMTFTTTQRRHRIFSNTITLIQTLVRFTPHSRHTTQTSLRVSTRHVNRHKIRPRFNRN